MTTLVRRRIVEKVLNLSQARIANAIKFELRRMGHAPSGNVRFEMDPNGRLRVQAGVLVPDEADPPEKVSSG